jgi:hypothetical protein
MKLTFLLCVLLIFSFLQPRLKSQDFWEEVFTSGPTIFSMDISEDDIIYLGTANGIWKSFDNGDNWVFDTISQGNLVVYSLETKPNGIVYAGCNHKIYYSDDFGYSWELIYDAVLVSNITSLFCIDSMILAGTWHGILRSIDNGNSWDHVLELYGSEYITTIVKDENDDLYAGSTGNLSLDSAGLYISHNYGNSWSHIEPTYHYGVQDIALNYYGKLIAAVIWDPGWIIGGIYEYNPFENSWQCLKYGERGRAIVVNKIDDYYAGIDNELSNGGCRASYDNDETWESINYGLSNSNIMEMEITQDGYLFCISSFPAKVFRSTEPTYTGISEINNPKEKISYYPNPFSKISGLFLESNTHRNFAIEIYNAFGKKVYSNTIFLQEYQTKWINTNDDCFIDGIYLLLIRYEDTIISSGKLIHIAN